MKKKRTKKKKRRRENLVNIELKLFEYLQEKSVVGSSWKENISKKFSISYVPSKTINWTKLVYGKEKN